jgi:hypothetical protein
MVIDSGLLRKNCTEYFSTYSKALDVLKLLNGTNSYKAIASKLNIPIAKTSGLQKKAEKLGLVIKQKNGCYKRVSGILGFMPKKSKTRTPNKQSDIIPLNLSEVQVRISRKLQKNTSINIGDQTLLKMCIAYGFLYRTENLLRGLIRKVFEKVPNWWSTRIPPGVVRSVTETKSKSKYYSMKRKDELEYTHLGQLKEIIVFHSNWKDFVSYLNETDKTHFEMIIDRAMPSRHSIGHCIPIGTKDLKTVEIRFQDIIDMIK